MAKNIKAIKCPQCGSNKHTDLGEDHFRCNNCGTEFFLDNDDINININHKMQRPDISSTAFIDNPKKIIYSVIICISFFFLMIFVNICTNTSNDIVDKVKNSKEKNYYEFSRNVVLINYNDKAIALTFNERSYYGSNRDHKDGRDGIYAKFIDLSSSKVMKEIKTDLDEKKLSYLEVDSSPDGKNLYAIIGRRLFLISPSSLTFEDITKNTFGHNKAFASGVASIKFLPGGNFNVINNEGRELFYVPSGNNVYDKEAYSMLTENSKGGSYTKYFMTEEFSKNNKLQLIRIKYSSESQVNRSLHSIKWENEELGSKGNNNVVTDITPGHLYFDASILYYDNNNIMVKYRPIAADDASYSLQLLTTSGKIVWTTELEKDISYVYVMRFPDGWWIKTESSIFMNVNNSGKILKKIDINKLDK